MGMSVTIRSCDPLPPRIFLSFRQEFKEGFPKAVVEALACGLPVVASNVSVIPSLIRDCGLVLDVPDAEHVAAAVADLVQDPRRMKTMGEKARQRAGGYTLEAWQAQISGHLTAAWNMELREHT